MFLTGPEGVSRFYYLSLPLPRLDKIEQDSDLGTDRRFQAPFGMESIN